ncbi:uncharacterized protein LOC132406091 [Hypanus sabinus]|uniref:uncharacterized protein LOC132406091 n=1 Tax=Hypanus sabinus TaxID=79690 RepID=UPI0028C41CD7|nr:uncharacterized protein LOC132406091 [Hypanus sabinus]XP_059847285.1 uncharacterized protein LOC132406091 [Hypanus sabinus]
MKTFTVAVFLLHIKLSLGTECRGISTSPNLTVTSSGQLVWSRIRISQSSLSLENCGISRIVNITTSERLQELNLGKNKLEEIPQEFLKNFPNLRHLILIDNPLENIPLSFIRKMNISFSCSCRVLKDMFNSCNESKNCTSSLLNLTCTGPETVKLFTLDNYYKNECSDLILVYILVPILLIAVIAIVVLVLVKYRSRISTHFRSPPSKRKSVCSADYGQQRYASTANWKDAAGGSSGAASGTPQDYENVFMGDSDRARSHQNPDNTYYLESDAACEIYQNEQPVYCNYTGPADKVEDDIYIVPDH